MHTPVLEQTVDPGLEQRVHGVGVVGCAHFLSVFVERAIRSKLEDKQ